MTPLRNRHAKALIHKYFRYRVNQHPIDRATVDAEHAEAITGADCRPQESTALRCLCSAPLACPARRWPALWQWESVRPALMVGGAQLDRPQPKSVAACAFHPCRILAESPPSRVCLVSVRGIAGRSLRGPDAFKPHDRGEWPWPTTGLCSGGAPTAVPPCQGVQRGDAVVDGLAGATARRRRPR